MSLNYSDLEMAFDFVSAGAGYDHAAYLNKENDPINAFSNFWRGFNNLFSRVEKRTEREKIKAYIGELFSEKAALELLEANRSNAQYLISQPVIDMRGNGKSTAPNIKAFELAQSTVEKLQEIFMVIYQIRCNLEHGEKSPNRERDVELCKNSLPFVASAISQKA